MSDQSDSNYPPMPTFSGNTMPLKVSIDVDDQIGEETTRRVGFAPSFSPSPFAFATPSLAPPSFSSTIATAPSAKVSSLTSPIRKNSRWVLQEAPTLPEFYPLEQSAVFIPHCSSPAPLASSISEYLKEQSIQATFQGNEAECVTEDNVEFSVYLYRGKKEYSHGIIVEVQRTFGFSFSFGETCQAVLDTAEGKPVSNRPLKKIKSLPLPVEDDYEVDPEKSLASIEALFEGGAEAQLLGLETLSNLTDSSKVGTKTAKAISKAVLDHPIAAIVLSILETSKPSPIIRQALVALSKVASNTSLPASVYPLLLPRLANASKDSQMAFLAAQCISQDAMTSRIADALAQAKLAAQDQHDGLYTVCSNLLAMSS